jgi:hypothetical protein
VDCRDTNRLIKKGKDGKVIEDLGNAYSFYPGEEEVLVFPFFTFIVGDVIR